MGLPYHPAMAFIGQTDESDAAGALREMYERYRDAAGQVDNILKVHSLNPPSLRAHFDLYATLMRGPSDLSKVQREMIAVVVSSLNECHY